MIETITIIRKQDNYTPDIPHPDICPKCGSKDVFVFRDKKFKYWPVWRICCRICWTKFD